jgi:hypothetical protein
MGAATPRPLPSPGLRAGEAMAHDRKRLAEIDKTAADVLL